MTHRLALLPATALLLAGCAAEPGRRLNAPPHGPTLETADSQGTLVYMADRALLKDMTVGDRHFVPHRAQLNALGLQRVSRLASLLHEYGGTVRFSSDLEDATLVAQRMDAVEELLRTAGVDTTRGDVLVRDLPGCEGMDARQAIEIKQTLGTYQAKSGSPSGASTGDTGTGTGTGTDTP